MKKILNLRIFFSKTFSVIWYGLKLFKLSNKRIFLNKTWSIWKLCQIFIDLIGDLSSVDFSCIANYNSDRLLIEFKARYFKITKIDSLRFFGAPNYMPLLLEFAKTLEIHMYRETQNIPLYKTCYIFREMTLYKDPLVDSHWSESKHFLNGFGSLFWMKLYFLGQNCTI